MATLESLLRPARVVLPPRLLIGRARRCDLCIDDVRVSGRHAEIRWGEAGWEIKDLGSRNGTRADEQVLTPGQWLPLEAGAELAFGSESERWRLVDAGPPRLPLAIPIDGGPALEAEGGLLFLPDPERPLACVRPLDLGWGLEEETSQRPLQDEEEVSVGGRSFRIYLPSALRETADSAQRPLAALLSLEFSVSMDEENVRLLVRQANELLDLGERVHHYMLLTLARQRLQDRRDGVGLREEGWLYRDQLTRMLGVDRVRLNIDVFRVRRQFAAAGVRDAAQIIERRASSQQLRLGVSRLAIARI